MTYLGMPLPLEEIGSFQRYTLLGFPCFELRDKYGKLLVVVPAVLAPRGLERWLEENLGDLTFGQHLAAARSLGDNRP